MSWLTVTRRPLTLHAVQYTGRNKDEIDPLCNCAGERQPHVHTLEGVMHVEPGDWIIEGVKGEFYPCKADIFERLYVREEELAVRSPT